jgi:hypothetical protein
MYKEGGQELWATGGHFVKRTNQAISVAGSEMGIRGIID